MINWLPEQRIRCPFCGEAVIVVVDTTPGSQAYVEDCQVCCQPMNLVIEIDDGEIVSVDAFA